MDPIEAVARKYRQARTLTQRKGVAAELQDSARTQALFAVQAAIVALLGARTFGAGESPAESPVALIAPFVPDSRELSTWLMQRYLLPAEFLALLESPHFTGHHFPFALNNLWSHTSDRPLLPFTRWLQPAVPDWGALFEALQRGELGQWRLGPEPPVTPQFEPFWLPVLERCAARMQSPDLPRWLVRAHGVCGLHAVEFAERRAITIDSAALSEEFEALAMHPRPEYRCDRWP